MSQQVKVYRELKLFGKNATESAVLTMGDSTTANPYTAGTPLVAIYATNAGTSGSTNAEPFYVKSTLTAAGQVGGRSRFHCYSNVASGGWVNALKSYMEFGSSGRSTGLASSLCAEMLMPNTTLASGVYAPLELEYVAGGTSTNTVGGLTGVHAAFMYMNNTGDADGDFDDNGYFMCIDGLTAGSAHMFATGTLRMAIGTTAYYIPLSSAIGTFTTAYPIVSTSTTGIRSTATLVPNSGRTNYVLAIGYGHDATYELDVTMLGAATQHLDPIAINLNIIGANPTGSSTINTIYQNITHDTTDMSYLRLKCADWNIVVGKDALDTYIFQGEIVFNAANIAVGNEVALIGLVLDAGANAVTCGSWSGITLTLRGAGTPSGAYGININNAGAGTLTNGIRILASATITKGITFGTDAGYGPTSAFALPAAGNTPVSTHAGVANGGTVVKIACLVGGSTYYILASTTPA